MVTTAIGAYNGAPCFEYEIVDDEAGGELLAVDLLIVHPKAGETWDDLAAIAAAFLRRRAMKWALSETEERRAARRERRTGGVRLAALAQGSLVAPEGVGKVEARHLAAVTVTKAEAEAERAQDLLVEELDAGGQPTGRTRLVRDERFRV